MNIQDLNDAINVLHHAAQLVSISGRFLAEPKENGSHTAMEYSHSRRLLVGATIKADKDIRVAIDITHFDLHILNYRLESLSKFDLKDRTKEEGFNFLNEELRSFGADTTLMRLETPYEISDHPVERGQAFEKPEKDLLEQHVHLRSLTKDILQSIARVFGNFSEILIWPQKFNTEMGIFIDPDQSGKMQARLSLGLAIMDSMIDQPYFYVQHGSEKNVIYPEKMPDLTLGSWNNKEWKGAYFKISDLDDSIDIESQEYKVAGFFSEAIERSIVLLTS